MNTKAYVFWLFVIIFVLIKCICSVDSRLLHKKLHRVKIKYIFCSSSGIVANC